MKSPVVSEINPLIKSAFGRFHRGDYHILGGGISGGSLIDAGKLEVIATKCAALGFGDPAMGVGIKALLNESGSVIVVIKKYEAKAKKYAELYREKFGKKVRIETRSGFYDLFPTEGLGSRSPFPMTIPEA